MQDKTANIGTGALIGGGLGGLYGLLSPLPEEEEPSGRSDRLRRLMRGLGFGATGAAAGALLGAPRRGAPRRGLPSMHDIAPFMKGVKTKAEAKSAYRAASRAAHPDMGGSTKGMQDLNAAWEKIQNHPEFSKLGHVNKAYAVGYLSALHAFIR